MSHYIAGAHGSKWGNPFKTKKRNKKSVKKCLERYEDHIRKDPDLFNAVMELEGKELGCWCKPFQCHGDILIKLFKEWQDASLCSDPGQFQVSACQTLIEQTVLSESESDQIIIPPLPTSPGSHSESPLRLNGGGDTFFASQENVNLEYQVNDLQNSMSEQDIRDVLFEAGYTLEEIMFFLQPRSWLS